MIKFWLARYLMLGRHSASTFPDGESLNFQALEAPLATDSYYFYGLAPDGHAWVARLAARSQNQTELWFALHLADGRRWQMEGTFPAKSGKWPAANGLSFERLGGGWYISFEGDIQQAEGIPQRLSFEAEFDPSSPIFDFSKLRDKPQNARALASMPWNREQFQKLASMKTSHIEQAGTYQCVLSISDETLKWQAHGARDHSTGHRDWDAWSAHSWFTGFDPQGRGLNLSLVHFTGLPVFRAGYLAEHSSQAIPWSGGPAYPIREPSGSLLMQAGKKQIPQILTFDTQCMFRFQMGNNYLIEEGWGVLHFGNQTYLGILERGSRIQVSHNE